MEKLYPSVNTVHKRVLRFLLLFVIFIPNLSLSQTIIYSSSFETPQVTNSLGYQYNPTSTEWTFYGQSGLSKNWTVFTGANPVAPSGNQVLFLQDNGNVNGYVEKAFSFQSSGYYRFLFKAAWREICCGKTKYIRVLVDGVEAGEVELRSENYEEYVTLPVKLTAGSHTIRIEGDNPQNGGDYTGFVDDFRIQKLPELPNNNNSDYTVQSGTVYAIGTSNYNFKRLTVKGTLVAPQNENVDIEAHYILVKNSGRFQIGQERSPYQHQATITLDGTNLTQHSGMDTKFLGAMNNGVIELHGKEKISWTRLSETANVGSPNIKVAERVDWEVGDEIVIAPSAAPISDTNNDYWNKYEKRTITSMTNHNTNLGLNASLTYRHTGEIEPYSGNGQNWTADMRAEVGLLTRNIKIQGSDSGDKLGAHVMIMNDAKAYISGVELYRMGQSATEGRYPFHWHQRGDADGQYFKNSSVHLSYNRALTIHRTNNTLVENNVFFDHIGHGIFFEEGNEEGNQILGNLVIGSKRPSGNEILTTSEIIDDIQNRGPASYWITHPNNTIEGNVAAGTIGTGFWYIFPYNDLGNQGKHPRLSPFGSFKNNVAHSTNNGFDIFDVVENVYNVTLNNHLIAKDHKVTKNLGYFPTNPNDFKIENCTWYANRVGVYTGTGSNDTRIDEYRLTTYAPDDWLIFKNNIFADNEKSIMLASNNQIKNSLFVDDTGKGNAPGSGRTMIHMYDGAGTISDSHIVGFNSTAGSMLSYAGATFTYGNFRFKNVTIANSGNNLVFNGTNANGPLRRNATVYDEDGSLTGHAGHTVVVNHPFMLLGGEADPSGWVDMKRSSRRYVNTRTMVHRDILLDGNYGSGDYSWFPDVKVIRTKTRSTVAPEVVYTGKTPVLPFIVNDQDLLYTYEWVYGPNETIGDIMYTGPIVYTNDDPPVAVNKRILQFKLAVAAEVGDFVIVRFKDMGDLPGAYVDMSSDDRVFHSLNNVSIPTTNSIGTLKSSTVSAYHIDPVTKDLYIKAYMNGDFSQFFNIKWNEVPGGSVANNTERLGGEQSLTEATEMVYPNPASTELHIKGLAEGEEVQIVDVSGKIMQTTTYKGYLDISQLESGVYIVRTKSGNHRFIKD